MEDWTCLLDSDNSMVDAVFTFRVNKMMAVRKGKGQDGKIVPYSDKKPQKTTNEDFGRN